MLPSRSSYRSAVSQCSGSGLRALPQSKGEVVQEGTWPVDGPSLPHCLVRGTHALHSLIVGHFVVSSLGYHR